MDSTKILIAMSNEKLIQKMKTILQLQGFNIADTTNNGGECLRKARALEIDIAIIDFDISPINGYEISKILVEDGLSNVILTAKSIEEIPDENLRKNDRFTLLLRPISKDILLNTIEVLAKSCNREKELQKQVLELKQKLSERKIIEKAKDILSVNMGVSEEEAFKFIQKFSMNNRIQMREVAQKIIDGTFKQE